jgi:HD-GYP domain-containing protein (c-di-GMP phosphodiesterase class II)
VAYYSSLIGQELQLNSNDLYTLELSAIFHDIGKIGIADSILLKPTKLNDEELKVMKIHPEISYNILKEFDEFEEIALYTRYHHENYDGSGYPHGLRGLDIPLCSRIMLIADTFDAMTSSRPYRKKLSNVQAFNELVKFSNTQFDEKLVEAFLSSINRQHTDETKQYNLDSFKQELHKKAA